MVPYYCAHAAEHAAIAAYPLSLSTLARHGSPRRRCAAALNLRASAPRSSLSTGSPHFCARPTSARPTNTEQHHSTTSASIHLKSPQPDDRAQLPRTFALCPAPLAHGTPKHRVPTPPGRPLREHSCSQGSRAHAFAGALSLAHAHAHLYLICCFAHCATCFVASYWDSLAALRSLFR